MLHKMKKIRKFWVTNGSVRYSIKEDGEWFTVGHLDDLRKEFQDVDLQESEVEQSVMRQAAQRAAQSARTAAQNARQAATQFTRRVAARLNAGYRPVPTSEIEAEQDIEMGDIGTAEQDVRSAQVAEGSAEDAFDDISRVTQRYMLALERTPEGRRP